MSNSKVHGEGIFKGFQLGPVLAAVLLGVGIQLLTMAFSWPLASLMVDVYNYILRVGRFDTVGLGEIHYSWLLVSTSVVPAIVLVFGGIRLGTWLHQGSTSKSAQ
jgi:hypothetical protein